MNGFYTTNGGKLYNCIEKDTAVGRTDFAYRAPAGYYSVPTRSVNPSLVMENCTSINSNGYGLQVDFAKNVQIKNFHLENPAGINGKGASLGGTNGQFSDSSVDIIASGDRVDTLAFGPKDHFVVPPWFSLTLQADDEVVLFSFSDRPVQQKLDLLGEKRSRVTVTAEQVELMQRRNRPAAAPSAPAPARHEEDDDDIPFDRCPAGGGRAQDRAATHLLPEEAP